MSDIIPLPITPPPGVVKTESPRSIEGRWSSTQNVRFVDGRPEKVGGWSRQTTTPMSGPPRTLHAWRDLRSIEYIAAGTYKKLYVLDRSYTPNDITPTSSTGTLGNNPFTIVNGSTEVTVAHTSHGRGVGDTVVFSGATEIGGTVMNGEFLVASVATNTYTVINSSTDLVGTLGNDSFTKVLLHFNGTDAATTFTDENLGGSGRVWTANGNAQLDTANKKFGSASGLFDGTGDYITTPDHADFALGSGDWTIDCWFNCNSASGTIFLAGQNDNATTAASTSFYIARISAGLVITGAVCVGGSTFSCTGTTQYSDTLNPGWHHVAFVRTGNSLKLFVDGVQEGTTSSITGTVNNSSNVLTIGRGGDLVGFSWNGWIDEFRFSVGVARWTTAFTPPTTAYITSGTGGGAAVVYIYEIHIGTQYGVYGLGYGVGGYGESTWGTPRAFSNLFIEPRIWSLDHFGQILLATYNEGTLYKWDPSVAFPYTVRAAAISDAPDDIRAMFVTPERFVIALCAGMRIDWCTQGDYTVWTPTASNTANTRSVTEGTKLVGGKPLGGGVSLIWSDAALYIHQYTGSSLIFDTRLAGRNCGLLSPSAIVTVGSVAYWMSHTTFFMFDGAVRRIPNVADIRAYVFDALRTDQGYLCAAMYSQKFHEVWFFVVQQGSSEPGLYTICNLNDFSWAVGTLERVSGTYFQHGDTRPFWATSDGHVHLHEDGHDNDGAAMSASITLAPYGLEKGNAILDLEGIEPDFHEQAGNVTLTINAWDRIRTEDDAVFDSDSQTVTTIDTLMDLRLAGRYVGMTVTSNSLGGHFRFGAPTVYAKPGGTRR